MCFLDTYKRYFWLSFQEPFPKLETMFVLQMSVSINKQQISFPFSNKFISYLQKNNQKCSLLFTEKFNFWFKNLRKEQNYSFCRKKWRKKSGGKKVGKYDCRARRYILITDVYLLVRIHEQDHRTGTKNLRSRDISGGGRGARWSQQRMGPTNTQMASAEHLASNLTAIYCRLPPCHLLRSKARAQAISPTLLSFVLLHTKPKCCIFQPVLLRYFA